MSPWTVVSFLAGASLVIAACGGQVATIAPPTAPGVIEPTASGWQPAQRIATSGSYGLPAMIAVDGRGRALGVWIENEAHLARLRAARYEPGRGWSLPLAIAAAESLDQSSLQLAMNSEGEAVVLAGPGTALPPLAVLYHPALGWSRPHLWPTAAARWPAAAIAEDGQVLALWQQDEGTARPKPLWAGEITRHGGLLPAQIVDASPAAAYQNLAVAVGGRGDAMAAWKEAGAPPDAPSLVFTSRWTAGRGWDGPRTTGESDRRFSYLAVAADHEGNATVLWRVRAGLEAAHYRPHGGWRPTAVMPAPGAFDPVLHFDAHGRALAVWRSVRGIEAARFDPRQGWSSPLAHMAPQVDEIISIGSVDAGVDDAGQALAVWGRDLRVRGAVYTESGGWAQPVVLQSLPRWGDWPRISVNGAGEAFAIWQQGADRGFEIWAARYIP